MAKSNNAKKLSPALQAVFSMKATRLENQKPRADKAEASWTEKEENLITDLVERYIRGEIKMVDIVGAHEDAQIFGDKKKGVVEKKIREIKTLKVREVILLEELAKRDSEDED